MSRDGSSGGTIRLAIITEDGVERIFVPGDKLPREFSVSFTLLCSNSELMKIVSCRVLGEIVDRSGKEESLF